MPDRAVCLTLFAEPITSGPEGTVAGFRGTAYSGGVVPNHGWAGDMAIDLSSLSLPETDVPVLRNHGPNQIVDRARLSNDGSQLQVVDGRFSGVTEVGRETSALMAEGPPWKLSLGLNANTQSADCSKPVTLNGRKLVVDAIYRNAGARIVLRALGADPNAYAAQLSSRHGIQLPTSGADDMNEIETARARIPELEASVAT